MYLSELVVESRLTPRTVDKPRAMPEIRSLGGIRIELKIIAFLDIYI